MHVKGCAISWTPAPKLRVTLTVQDKATGSTIGQRRDKRAANAREYFQRIVVPDYAHFQQSPNDIRLLFNALVSMNTVPEFLALHRLGYALDISCEKLDEEVETIRVDLRLVVAIARAASQCSPQSFAPHRRE